MNLRVKPVPDMLKRDIVDAIGDTPLVDVSVLSPVEGVRIYAKLEGSNPSGSVKDRVAKYMIEAAERDGLLKPGDTIIEPTSGNTGVSLAMIARARGYNLKVVMPAGVTQERIDLLIAYGAEIIFSDADKGTNEAIIVAKQIAADNPDYYFPYQYGNEANTRAHFETTGPEIIRDLPEIDIFIGGLGTGGTLMGNGKALRLHNPNVKIVAVAPPPDDVIQGLRSIEHGFIPEILDLDQLDARILIESEDSFFWTQQLMERCGIFAGISSGAVIACARKMADKIGDGTIEIPGRAVGEANIVALLPDGGWKYMSTQLWTKTFKEIESEVGGKIWW
ncbi:MAG: cysteine synthase family protein [Dehalococcoidia bacterium]